MALSITELSAWPTSVMAAVTLNTGDIVDSPHSHHANSAENAEKPFRETLLAEPFPGTVAQGFSLPKVREMKASSFGKNQRAAQIRVLGGCGRREWVSSIFVVVGDDSSCFSYDRGCC
jgi:hypothetical protein